MVVLVAAGLLAGGYMYHKRTVHFTETVEYPPPPPLTDPITGEVIGPPLEPVTETVERSAIEPEPRLVLEVTRGGVERLASGQIKRTYEGAEPADALCPT